jgi:hypothetical protein
VPNPSLAGVIVDRQVRPTIRTTTTAWRASGNQPAATRNPAERHRAMNWAQRLKRVFQLDLSSCEGCGGQVRVIASIEDPLVIGKILEHLERSGPGTAGAGQRPEVRGPPRGALELAQTRPSEGGAGRGRAGPRCAPGGVRCAKLVGRRRFRVALSTAGARGRQAGVSTGSTGPELVVRSGL